MSEKNESLLEKEDRDDEVEKVRSLGARFRIPPKSRVFVVTVFVQFLLVFAFTIQYLVALSRTSSSSPDPVDPSPPSPSNADNHSIAIFFTLNVLFSALILLYFAIDAAEDFEKARSLQPNNPQLVVNYKKIHEIAYVELCDPGDSPEPLTE